MRRLGSHALVGLRARLCASSSRGVVREENVGRKRAFNPPWMSDTAHIRHRNVLVTVLAESTAYNTSDQLRP